MLVSEVQFSYNLDNAISQKNRDLYHGHIELIHDRYMYHIPSGPLPIWTLTNLDAYQSGPLPIWTLTNLLC